MHDLGNNQWIRRMEGFVIVLLSLILCFFSCSVKGKKVNRDKWSTFNKYLGRGYDILFGYPFPNSEFKDDPGFKESIIDTSYTINVVNDFTCKRDDYLTVIDGINSFMDLILYYINIEDFDIKIRPFSASSPYRIYFENLEIKNKKYAISQSICLTSYVTFNISDSAPYMNQEFLKNAKELPVLKAQNVLDCPKELYEIESDNTKCVDSIKPWIEFFRKYGTHLLIAARFGGLTLNTFEISNRKAREIKINNYNYSIKNIPILNFNYLPDILLDDFLDAKKKKNKKIEKGEPGENSAPWDVKLKGGIDMALHKGDLTYEIWKGGVREYFVPIHLDLLLLSSLMVQDKHESYNIALAYYNELYGLSKQALFFSQDIKDFLGEGIQVTDAKLDRLTLTCPPGTVIGTGFIVTIDNSGTVEASNANVGGVGTDTQKTTSRIRVHPCIGDKYNVSCSYMPKKEENQSFGWLYCIKEKFERFETLSKNGEDEEEGKPLKIECPKSTIMALGFHIELEKKSEFTEWKFSPCKFGANDCSTPTNISNDLDSVIWGFCITATVSNPRSVANHFVSGKNVDRDVYAQCTNHEDIPQNIYLGLVFSFTKELNQLYVDKCESSSKKCTGKVTSLNNDNYVGALFVCDASDNVSEFIPLLNET